METFLKEQENFWNYLETHPIWVVATGNNNDITASSMCIIGFNDRIYFQTDNRFEKYALLKNNKHIALCFGNHQIKGIAKDLASTKLEENSDIMKAYKKKHPDSYSRYSNKSESVLIEIVPTMVKCWDYINSDPYIFILDFKNETYKQERYQ